MVQSTEEILRIFDEWGRHYAPSNFIQNEQNAKRLFDYVSENYGLVSITYLTQAANALASQLDLVPEPKKLTVEEQAKIFQEREFKRIQREQAENSIPFSERIKAETEKRNRENAAKAQLDAKGELAVAISGYQCYRPNGGGIDYTATETVKNELRTVKFGNDAVRTLAVVRQIILELPDYPKMGDVARVVEKLNARARANKQAAVAAPRIKGIW